MNADRPDITQSLIEAMRQEVDHTMTMTNTSIELERFQEGIARRRRRRQIYASAVAAAAALIVGGVVFATHSPGAHRSPSPASSPSLHSVAPKPAVATAILGAPSPLPQGTPLTSVFGPDLVGPVAFGSVWATAGTEVYRIDTDGQHAVSVRKPFNSEQSVDDPPFRAGAAVLVPSYPAGESSAYVAFDADGHIVGSIPVAAAGPGAGDASGGWARGALDSLVQIDATGTHGVRTITLPGAAIAGVAVGDGSVWVTDSNTNAVLRIDPTSGQVTGRVVLEPDAIVLGLNYGNGSVYVASKDYGLRRIDPTTMTVKAATFGANGGSWFVFTIAPDGNIWAQPAQGVVDELDPTTLATKRAIQLRPTEREGGAIGLAVTSDRLFMADVDYLKVWSFPLT